MTLAGIIRSTAIKKSKGELGVKREISELLLGGKMG